MCLLAGLSSCHKRTPPAATIAVPPAPQPRKEPTPQLPPAPTVPTTPPTEPPLQTQPQVPPPPAAPRTGTRRTRPPQHPATPPTPEPAAPANPTPQAEPPTRVGPLLSAADQQKYNSEVVAAVTTAERNLAEAQRKRRSMNQRQQTMFAQAQNFVLQAKELRESDLVAARAMAERALQVSRDLVASLR